MLRRAENVSIAFKAGFFSGRGWITVFVGRSPYRTVKLSRVDFSQMCEAQIQFPVAVLRVKDRTYWQFQNRFYWDNDDLTAEAVHALLVTRQQRQQGQIERAQAMVAMGVAPQAQSSRRDVIPDDVKQLVWLRDGGRCRNCGAQTELQFDHIIPVAMGGNSAPENLQILCGPCNRRKSSGLTLR